MFKYVVAALLLVCPCGLANAQSSQSIGLTATVGASCTLGTFNTSSFTITPSAGGTVAPLGSAMTTTAPVVCNQNVKIKLVSSSVGLANSNSTTPTSGYVNKIHYTANATYNGISELLDTSSAGASAGTTATTAGAQAAGTLTLAVNPVATPANNVLVAGTYSDTLTVTVTPTP